MVVYILLKALEVVKRLAKSLLEVALHVVLLNSFAEKLTLAEATHGALEAFFVRVVVVRRVLLLAVVVVGVLVVRRAVRA
jgi:hypothetical protein